ncbi:MAG TPA: prephenate dehydrogenase/arogenate dehydrogenase family protein, partial [Thermohalobaculum sp.]|nr:prephenate dehydrogenase/arogenate dehydrogenase family protein [Thermohalobaculum sp.]
MTAEPYERLALIGLGLIGSSIAWAARRAGAAGEIVGYARTAETRETAARLGFCDRVAESAAEAVRGADLVILCVPVGAFAAVAAEIGPELAPGATVSDAGSVKGRVIEQLAPRLPEGVHLVPAHPLAGTEHSGPESGFAELFEGRWCILTPLEGGDRAATDRL